MGACRLLRFVVVVCCLLDVDWLFVVVCSWFVVVCCLVCVGLRFAAWCMQFLLCRVSFVGLCLVCDKH